MRIEQTEKQGGGGFSISKVTTISVNGRTTIWGSITATAAVLTILIAVAVSTPVALRKYHQTGTISKLR